MGKKTTKTDIYQKVTDQIIAAIENGLEGNFELPWHHISAVPQNARTGNFYNGVNVPLLWVNQIHSQYVSGQWATYKQWAELGAQVKKGEKGAPVVFWKAIDIEPEEDNEEAETRMFARWSTVFNADQVEGYDVQSFEPSDIQAIGAADAVIDASGADIRHEGQRAFYSVSGDYISVPCPKYFKATCDSSATENYYSTIFHELVHWTGSESRLDRQKNNKFGGEDYAFEELIAELGAAMVCAKTGVATAPRQDHAHYIKNWLEALKSDKRFIFSASSQAQKAADFLFSLQETSQEAEAA